MSNVIPVGRGGQQDLEIAGVFGRLVAERKVRKPRVDCAAEKRKAYRARAREGGGYR